MYDDDYESVCMSADAVSESSTQNFDCRVVCESSYCCSSSQRKVLSFLYTNIQIIMLVFVSVLLL